MGVSLTTLYAADSCGFAEATTKRAGRAAMADIAIAQAAAFTAIGMQIANTKRTRREHDEP